MNKDSLLKMILESSTLKQKYWPDCNSEEWNINTIGQSPNKYHKALYEIFNEKSTAANQKALFHKILNIFEL